MTVNSVSSNSNTVAPAAPARQAQATAPIDKPAEKTAAPTASVQAPKQPEPTVNTSGQRIGTTISTSA